MKSVPYPVMVDTDPDNADCWSIWTDTDGINAEVCGKIADRDIALELAALMNATHYIKIVA